MRRIVGIKSLEFKVVLFILASLFLKRNTGELFEPTLVQSENKGLLEVKYG
jgi:hypothetical protein